MRVWHWGRQATGWLVLSLAFSGAVPLAHSSAGANVTTTAKPYPCRPGPGGTVYGAHHDAAVIGWEGNHRGVVACLGGSFYVQDGINTTYGFGVYNYSRTRWYNAGGYLPALVTAFSVRGAQALITNFADRVVIGGHPYVVVYSRAQFHNPTAKAVDIKPAPSPGLVALDRAPDVVAPGTTVDHDYVVVADRFGGTYPWPTPAALQAAGGYGEHFDHMKSFWDRQLSDLAQLQLPDSSLVNAYKAGFIYTQIDRSGNALDTGTNGYQQEYSHDVIGILASLFTEGDFTDAQALLENADEVVGTESQYADGEWTYSWPWAIYLEKTGDLPFVKAHFADPGPLGPSQEPSIEATAHEIVSDRTGPGGIMGATSDIDANGYWTSDDYEALMGLAAYEYLARAVGQPAQAAWAAAEYSSLLEAVDKTLEATISKFHLDYLPCSMLEPNTDNRCANPEDANWAAPAVYTNWAWNAFLLGAEVEGPGRASMASWLDKTLNYGMGRLKGKLPPNTFGGYPGDYYSTGYNAGYGSWGLGSNDYRDQGVLSYEFMVGNDQAGPYSWWESSSGPAASTPWVGRHPATGNGSSPHSWGIATANLALIGSLADQVVDGGLIIGRGVPDNWVANGKTIKVSNLPTVDQERIGFSITTRGLAVTLRIISGVALSPVLFELPAFVGNIAGASTGVVDPAAGTVTVPPATQSVTVTLAHAP